MAAISSGVVIRRSKGILATTLFNFSSGEGRSPEPLPVERCHYLGRDNSVHPNAVGTNSAAHSRVIPRMAPLDAT